MALRRAGRTAIVMPAMFALGDKVIGNAQLATFAAFGAFAMLLLVDFGGPMRERLQAQASLALTGAVLVCVGTAASREPWLAAGAMALVGFGALFAGVVSSVLAGATTSMLLAFILPVSLSAPVSEIPDRLAGWALASVASLIAIALLWPAPAEDRLRGQASATCRALAVRLRAEVAYYRSTDPDERSVKEKEHGQAVEAADAAVAALHRLFLATPYRPTGLSTSARATVRLVDELNWLNAVLAHTRAAASDEAKRSACTVKAATARVLELGAELLEAPHGDPEPLRGALLQLQLALTSAERTATHEFPARLAPSADAAALAVDQAAAQAVDWQVAELMGALDPSFRAQELSFVASLVGRNIDGAAAAERRTWIDRLLGRQPPGLAGTLSAAQERAAAHVERHSVWLHNSVRGAVGLGLAVLIADKTGVQHSFWVVLGTLSVLRSSALNTGQNALRAVLGTAAGFAIGAILLVPIGHDTVLLWWLLPLAILVAGVAPAVISFAAGQAGFTLVLVILFNIIQPSGWRVGLIRVEDIALGCAVSVVVGLLFWPRGAGAALSKALAEAYADNARYLAAAVDFGMRRCDRLAPTPVAPEHEAVRAAASSRRMDDAFRGFLAERGAKVVALAEVTRLVTGASGLRLAADAVLDLWARDDDRAVGDRTAARTEILQISESVTGWYGALADSLDARRPAPAPLPRDELADGRLVRAVGRDLRGEDGQATAAAVRVVWTSDHLDAARRLQSSLIQPALAVANTRGTGQVAEVA
jgi:Fusaric acid resistance protein-like